MCAMCAVRVCVHACVHARVCACACVLARARACHTHNYARAARTHARARIHARSPGPGGVVQCGVRQVGAARLVISHTCAHAFVLLCAVRVRAQRNS